MYSDVSGGEELLNQSLLDSDSDDGRKSDEDSLKILWLQDAYFGIANLGLSSLPGCRYKNAWRDLKRDVDTIKVQGVTDVFCLVTEKEMKKFRVPSLLNEYRSAGLKVHHYPCMDGEVYSVPELMRLVNDIVDVLKKNGKPLIHCYGGSGRTCFVVTAVLLTMHTTLSSQKAVSYLEKFRGSPPTFSIKQFNFIHDFPQLLEMYKENPLLFPEKTVNRPSCKDIDARQCEDWSGLDANCSPDLENGGEQASANEGTRDISINLDKERLGDTEENVGNADPRPRSGGEARHELAPRRENLQEFSGQIYFEQIIRPGSLVSEDHLIEEAKECLEGFVASDRE